CQMYTNSPFTF
nr:immunoglobulin light chain junction region [Macaca mulatta]MOW14243.1 immunoglobulin light chain junction region [Macaca mulatta]